VQNNLHHLEVVESERNLVDSARCERQQSTDSVEKVAPLADLRQNLCIGRRGITQHDGTGIEWAGSAVLLVQP